MTEPNQPDRLLTIGAMARACGLSASALRFYDREGVLVPAFVDASTGYRRYAVSQLRAARIVASLRRVGMSLAEVSVVLELQSRGEVDAARDVVAAHEQRLVDGLRDARAEIARTLALLGDRGGVRAGVRAGDLAEALAAVRFAVAPGVPVKRGPHGAELTALTGVLVEVTTDALRFVATDRYRLAVAEVPRVGAAGSGTDPARDAAGRPSSPSAGVVASVVAPVGWVDEVAARCGSPESADASRLVHLDVSATGLVARFMGADGAAVAHSVEAEAVPGSFPDHRGIVEPVGRAESVVVATAADLADVLSSGADRVGLAVRAEAVTVVPDDDADVFVDPEFLREALSAAGPRPSLAFDGPLRPLAVRGGGVGFSVLMPVAAR